MSSVGMGRGAATVRSALRRVADQVDVDVVSERGDVRCGDQAAIVQDTPAEVVEFIRWCYRRRGFGWPELYDEMCAAAARGTYRGMDYDHLERLGIGFSLAELPRLAALANRVVAEERQARRAGTA